MDSNKQLPPRHYYLLSEAIAEGVKNKTVTYYVNSKGERYHLINGSVWWIFRNKDKYPLKDKKGCW